MIRKLISILLLLLITGASHAVTVYVNKAVGSSGTGYSWATAKKTIQEGIDVTDATEVWVASGIYDETRTVSDSTHGSLELKANVPVYGGFLSGQTALAQRDWVNNVTTIDGRHGRGTNQAAYTVVGVGVDGATLDGFTVTNGNANNTAATEQCRGGGVFINAHSVTIRNCIFTLNHATVAGGAICMENCGTRSVIIENCTFDSNDNNSTDVADRGLGGAINVLKSQPQILRCTFINNTARYGAGIYTVWSCSTSCSNGQLGDLTPYIDNCVFYNNRARAVGGGVYCHNSNAQIRNCTFYQNASQGIDTENSGTTTGGAITMSNIACLPRCPGTSAGHGYPYLRNCAFLENSGGGTAQVLRQSWSSPSSWLADQTCQYAPTNLYTTAGAENFLRLNGTGSNCYNTGTALLANDRAGNTRPQGGTGHDIGAYELDPTAPTVTSIVRQNPSGQRTNAASVVWRVTFSESVMWSVQTGDFTLTKPTPADPINGYSVTSVTRVDETHRIFDVTCNTGTGDGTLRLDVTVPPAQIKDLGLVSLAANYTSGQTYIIDKTLPTVVSVNRQTPAGQNTNAASVVWSVVFSEDVTGSVATTDFTLTKPTPADPISGYSVTGVTGSGITYQVTCSTGTGNGTLRLDVVTPAAVISDLAGNALTANFTGGQTYIIDKTLPTVASINRQTPAGQNTNAASVVWSVIFSEDVTGSVGTTDFTLTKPTPADPISGYSVTGVTGSGTSYQVTCSTGTGNGTLRLDVITPAAVITDLAGNALTANYTGGQTYIIDKTLPTVASINRQTPAGQNTNAASVVWSVIFSEDVTGSVGTTDFTLTKPTPADSISGYSVTGVTGSGTTYQVTCSTGTGDGTLRLDVITPAAVITDLAGNALTANYTGGQTYSIDKTRPTVASINRQTPPGQNTTASSVVWRVVFSEDVTGSVATTDFTLTKPVPADPISGYSVTGVTGSGTTYDVTCSTGTGTGELRLDVVTPAAVITDLTGNALTANYTLGQTYIVDTPPTVVSINRLTPLVQNTNAGSVVWRVIFNEDVSGSVGTTDFTLTKPTPADSISGYSVTGVTGSGTTYDVSCNTGTGNGELRLDVVTPAAVITDLAGNALTANYTGGQTYVIDKTLPTVASINRQTPAGQNTNATSVVWSVVFSEDVTGSVAATDFTLSKPTPADPINGYSVTNVTGSGTSYQVTCSTGTGDGTLRLDVVTPAAVITDLSGNALSANYTGGQTYVVDKTLPTVVSVNRQTPAGQNTNATSVVWSVVFSEDVTGSVGTTDFTLTKPLPADPISGYSVTAVNGSGTTYQVTCNTGTGNGELRLDVATPAAVISDLAGNALTANYTGGQTYVIDKTLPTVVSVNRQTPVGQNTNATSVVWSVVFSEDVTGSVATTDFTLTKPTPADPISGYSVTGVTGSGTTYQVTCSTGTGDGALRLDVVTPAAVISDLAGNALTANYTGGQTYVIDKTRPTVASINRQTPAGQNTNAASVVWSVVFSEDVTGAVGTTDFTLTKPTPADTISGYSVSGVNGSGTTYQVTCSTGTGDGALRLDVVTPAAVITDLAGNALTANYTGGQTYIIDRTLPTVASINRQTPAGQNTNATSVVWSVVFSEDVTGAVGTTDFTLTKPTPADTISGYSVTGVTGSGTSYQVTCNTGTDNGTLRLDVVTPAAVITDLAGNALTANYTGAQTYTFDKTPPTVLSITRLTPLAQYTNAGSVIWQVLFSEDVTGSLATSDFTLTEPTPADPISGYSVSSFTGSGTTYDVTCGTGSNSGELRLDVVAGTATISDLVGNSLVTNYVVGQTYYIDKNAPVPNCANPTVFLSVTPLGEIEVTPAMIDGGSTDNYGITSRTINGGASVTFDCSHIAAPQSVTLGLADAAGNPSSCVATVTVQDTTDPTPVARTPGSITVYLSSPELLGDALDQGSTDNCGIVEYLIDGAESRTFGCDDIGDPVVVELTVSDVSGNSATTSTTVNVVDDVDPIAECRTGLVLPLNASGFAGLAVGDIDTGSSDNCDNIVMNLSQTGFTCGNLGNNPVTLTVTDDAFNESTCVTNVDVVDLIAPVISLIGPSIDAIVEDRYPAYIDQGTNVSDNCDTGLTVTRSGFVNTFEVGQYSLFYNVTDLSGNDAVEVERIVNVTQNEPPVISITGADPAYVECGSTYADEGATATDPQDGTLPVTTVSNNVNPAVPGAYSVVYTATDTSNTTVQDQREVYVVDNTAPVITLLGSEPTIHECGEPYVDAGATAEDVCQGDVSSGITANIPVSANSLPGTYTVSYSVTDDGGNTGTRERTVIVEDTGLPVLTLIGAADHIHECGTPYNDEGTIAIDSCQGDISSRIVTDNPVSINSDPGVYTVTYTVDDPSGNDAVAITRTVTVQDTGKPVITLNSGATIVVLRGTPFTEPGAVVSDVCDGNLPFTVGGDLVDVDVLGTYTLTYDATDSSGNIADQVTRRVIVSGVGGPPIIIADPVDQSVDYADSASFTVTASSTTAVTYRWRKNGVNLIDGGRISGAMTRTLAITGCINGDEGSYDCVATNIDGPATSGQAQLLVRDPAIKQQPANTAVGIGQVATFNVVAVGSSPVTYQWYKFGTPPVQLTAVPGKVEGVTSPTLTIRNAQDTDEGLFYVVVSGADGDIQSSTVRLRVGDPVIVTNPQSQTVPPGVTVTFFVVAEGTAPIRYQWKRNGGNLVNDGRITGTDTNTLTLRNVSEADEATYSVVVIGVNVAESAPATLTIGNPPVIQTVVMLPSSGIVPPHGLASLSVVLSGGSPPFTYQWLLNGQPLSNAGNISGADGPTLTITNAGDADEGLYTVEVSNDSGTAISEPKRLIVGLTFAKNLPDRLVEANTKLTWGVEVTGGLGSLVFNWKRETFSKAFVTVVNDGRISGAEINELTFEPVEFEDAGRYFVEVSDDFESIVSRLARLDVVASLPAFGLAGLASLAGLLAGMGAVLARRRR